MAIISKGLSGRHRVLHVPRWLRDRSAHGDDSERGLRLLIFRARFGGARYSLRQQYCFGSSVLGNLSLDVPESQSRR